MLLIACISSSYAEGKKFVEYKFANIIKEVNLSSGVYTLNNGDKIYLCYGNENSNSVKSMEFDAYFITPSYSNMELEIKYRTMRGNKK